MKRTCSFLLFILIFIAACLSACNSSTSGKNLNSTNGWTVIYQESEKDKRGENETEQPASSYEAVDDSDLISTTPVLITGPEETTDFPSCSEPDTAAETDDTNERIRITDHSESETEYDALSRIVQSTGSGEHEEEHRYIGNKNSKKFHLPTCATLPKLENQVYFDTREEAISEGYVPCKNCNP